MLSESQGFVVPAAVLENHRLALDDDRGVGIQRHGPGEVPVSIVGGAEIVEVQGDMGPGFIVIGICSDRLYIPGPGIVEATAPKVCLQ